MNKIKSFELNGSTICHKEYDPKQDRELHNILQGDTLERFIESTGQKIILVLGGDGTMLSAIRENYDRSMPFLGINFGSLGFLLNYKEALQERNFTAREYPLLNISNHGEHIGTAFNEVHIRGERGEFLKLIVTINGQSEVPLGGDGLILSTPAGSTGHNLSHHGFIIDHKSPNLILTPVGSNPYARPVLLSNSDVITIENIKRLHPLFINLDGDKSIPATSQGEKVSYEIKLAREKVTLLIAEAYGTKWDNKVREAQGFRQVIR